MTVLDHTILTALAYVLTGVALVGYDMAAPPTERKAYVVQKNFKVAFITWFVWPATVIFEAIEEHRMRRRYLSFLMGVVMLAVGIFFWAHVAYLVVLWAIGIKWIGFVVTAIAMLLACPIISGVAMPSHVRPESR